MRYLMCATVLMSLTACFPTRPESKRMSAPSPAAKIADAPDVAAPSPPPLSSPASVIPPPSTPAGPARATVRDISGITFEGVAFDSRSQRLAVVDQPGGPGSQFADAAAAAKSRGGLAAVNAGFFTPEGAPLGLVSSSGKISGSWNSASSLGNSVWYENSAIVRREKLGRSAASGMRELIQAGPLLVENGHAVGGLEATKTSARIVLLWDGGTRWWIGRGSPCTLAALGQALATDQPAGWSVRQALNLDGGRSADLWISDTVPGGPVSRRPPWNRPVRNFLVLISQ